MEFEWDPEKAASNEAKHGVTFEEAASVFADTRSRTAFDEAHSEDEDRLLTLGISIRGRLVVVWHTDRGERIRIIGARPANKVESKAYPNG